MLTDSKQVEKLSNYFADFEQVEKLSSYFASLNKSKKISSYFTKFGQVKKLVVILMTLGKSKWYLSLSRFYLHTLFITIWQYFFFLHNHLSKSFLTCTHPCFLSAKVYFHLNVFVWMIFLFVKNIVTVNFDWIMNAKCFIMFY